MEPPAPPDRPPAPGAERLPGPLDRIRHRDLTVEGRSRAGHATWFRVRPPNVAFDAGGAPLRLVGVRGLFLSHGHLDHSLGVPYLLAHRTTREPDESLVYAPRESAAALGRLVEAAAALEGTTYRYRIVPLEPGDRVELDREWAVEAFAVDHVVASLGYHLWRRKRLLALHLEGRPEAEIARRSRAGETVDREVEELWLSYCGDTRAAVFDREPRLFEAKLLLCECTFLGEDRGRAAEFGHLHLDDLVERQELFANELVVLHHLSRRHRLAELEAAVAERLPRLAGRVRVLGGSAGR